MMNAKRLYWHLSILAAAPVLFSFCEKDTDLKRRADNCPKDFINSRSVPLSPQQCTVTTYDSKCTPTEIPIDCDQKDDLADSPYQKQSQSVEALQKQAGIQSVPRRSLGAPAVTVTAGANELLQSLQRLLPFSIDLFTTSSAVPSSFTCDPGLNFYAVEHTNATVAHEFPCNKPPFPRIQVATRPLQVAITPDSRELWVTSYDNAITVIDTNTDKVLTTIAAGPSTFPSGIAISPDGTRVYVTSFIDFASALVTYNRATRSEIARVSLPTDYPQSVSLTPDGSMAFVTHPLGNAMYVVDTLSNAIIASRQISQPYGVGFSPNGTTAYISSWPNSVVVMDMKALNITKTYQVGSSPINVMVSGNGRWVTTDNYGDGTLSTIDTLSGAVTSLHVGGSPHGITFIN